MKIGVISDTHNFLEPKVARLFAGVEHILHAGDVGSQSIILGLEEIAPTTAVSGNTDDSGNYQATEVVTLAGRKFLLHHIVNPCAPGEDLQERITREQPDVVVFGHTHQQYSATVSGRLYFNPGYAGKSRFGMERSVAILHCDEKGIRHEFLRL